MTDRQDSPDLLQEPWLHQSYLIGHPLEQRARPLEALEIYHQVLERDTRNILAHLLRGRALLNLIWEEKYQATERGEPLSSEQEQLHLKREEEAHAAFRQALQLADQALQRTAEDVQAWIYKGDALWMLDEQEQEGKAVIATYDRAIHLAPENPEAYVNKGWVLFTLSHLDEALAIYEQALHLRPNDPDILCRKNNVLWELRRYEEALETLEQAIALDPTQPRFYRDKATLLSSLHRGEEAHLAQAYYQHLVEERDI